LAIVWGRFGIVLGTFQGASIAGGETPFSKAIKNQLRLRQIVAVVLASVSAVHRASFWFYPKVLKRAFLHLQKQVVKKVLEKVIAMRLFDRRTSCVKMVSKWS